MSSLLLGIGKELLIGSLNGTVLALFEKRPLIRTVIKTSMFNGCAALIIATCMRYAVKSLADYSVSIFPNSEEREIYLDSNSEKIAYALPLIIAGGIALSKTIVNQITTPDNALSWPDVMKISGSRLVQYMIFKI